MFHTAVRNASRGAEKCESVKQVAEGGEKVIRNLVSGEDHQLHAIIR